MGSTFFRDCEDCATAGAVMMRILEIIDAEGAGTTAGTNTKEATAEDAGYPHTAAVYFLNV